MLQIVFLFAWLWVRPVKPEFIASQMPTTRDPTSSNYPPNLPVDISPAYVQWSKWQHDRLLDELRSQADDRQIYNRTVKRVDTGNYPKRKPTKKPKKEYITTPVTKAPIEDEQTTMVPNIDPEIDSMLAMNDSSDGQNITTIVVYSTGTSIVLALLTAIISFITIFGNLLVLLSFVVERALRTATNYFIASLAVTDVLIGVFSMNLYTLYLLLGRWPLGRLSCDLWLSLDYTACLTSQYTVLFITLDRFFSVRIPAKYRNWRTDRKVAIMVAATWIIPSSVFFIIIMGWPYFNSTIKPRPVDMCSAEFANDPIFNTIFTVCYFWVTFFFLIGLYAAIYKVAENLQKRSDEKRGRISGLIRQPGATNGKGTGGAGGGALRPPADGPLTNAANRARPQHSPQPHSSSSMIGVNESSGFDSDEEQKAREKRSLAKPNNIKSKRPTINTLRKPDVIVQSAVSTKPNEDRCNSTNVIKPKPVNPINKTVEKGHNPIVIPKVAVLEVKKKTAPRQECPLHRKEPIPVIIGASNGQPQPNHCSPASVRLSQPEGIQIISPVLTDDDSGFEVNGVDELAPRYIYLPPSPAMCICSDLEEEQHGTIINGSQPVEQGSPSVVSDEKGNTTPVITKTPAERITTTPTTKSKTTAVINVPPVRSAGDPDYQNRVMEAFRRRMAANSLPIDDVHIKSNNVTPNRNPINHTNIITRAGNVRDNRHENNHHKPISSSDDQSGTDIQSIFISSGPLDRFGPDQITCQSTDTNPNLEDTSPIWKPQIFTELDTFSTACSNRGLSCYDHTDLNEWGEPHQECLICAGQQESDTERSSSTYGEYVGPNLVERRCCCYTMSMTNESHRLRQKTGNVTRCYPLAAIPISLGQVIRKKCKNGKWFVELKEKWTHKSDKKAPIERGRRENRARKALRTITFILGAYLLCWTPYHVVIMIKGICDDLASDYTCVDGILYSVTYWLCYMNSPVNPFCYALANALFKKTFIRIFHGDFRRT